MRISLSRAVLLATAGVVCASLLGCSGGLFNGTVTWKGDGGIYVNDRKIPEEQPSSPMQLTLRPDGTGSAVNIPQGNPKFDDNICIETSSDKLYTGEISWRNETNANFEIAFEGSEYTLISGPEKFHINWNEIRLYNCNWGPEYWRLNATVDMELIPVL